MSAEGDNGVLLFVKAPVEGQVKTRLAAEIGADCAVGLYRCFVEDIVSVLDHLKLPVQCCYAPPGAGASLVEWLGRCRSYRPQRGNDLGQRMKTAFRSAFATGLSRAIVIGSDIPDMPADFIVRAFLELGSHDAVIGPSRDGGYYLIGFTARRFVPQAFEDICWSSDGVLARTLEILKSRGATVFILPPWQDIDTWSDLRDLIRRNATTSFRSSRTFAFIRRCKWLSSEGKRLERSGSGNDVRL